MTLSLAALWLTLSSALAGSGPWTLPSGATNLYVGSTQTRYSKVQNGDRNVEIGAVAATTLMAVGTIGLMDGVEAELVLPWIRATHLEPDRGVCRLSSYPRDACSPTSGLGPLDLTLKARFLDEAALRPLTMSVAFTLRNADATAEYRDRFTAIGDGQTDLGLGTALGRTGRIGASGWYRASLDARYLYRLPLPSEGTKVPADQVEYALGAVVAPVRWLGLGPRLAGFHRLGGTSLADSDPRDPNRFPGLAAAQLKAGGEVAISGDNGLTVSLAAMGTLWARNNPSDTRVVSVGLGWYAERRAAHGEPSP